MRSRHLDGPWNPEEPVEVTPEEYEHQVLAWLRASESNQADLHVKHLKKITGSGGEYEFDVVARFTRFGGAEFVVLVECKRYAQTVKRDLVLTLHAKLADVGAHKGMMFSTGGFQQGAIEYASQHGIALVIFQDGKATYQTRARGPVVKPSPWVDLPRFVGVRMTVEEVEGHKRWRSHTLQDGDVGAIDEFLADT